MSNPHPKYKGALPSINEAPSQKESPHTRTCTCIHNRTRTHTRTRTRTQTCRGVARIKIGGGHDRGKSPRSELASPRGGRVIYFGGAECPPWEIFDFRHFYTV